MLLERWNEVGNGTVAERKYCETSHLDWKSVKPGLWEGMMLKENLCVLKELTSNFTLFYLHAVTVVDVVLRPPGDLFNSLHSL